GVAGVPESGQVHPRYRTGNAGAADSVASSATHIRPKEHLRMSVIFTVGDLTIHRVIESEGPLFDPLTFFPTMTRELLDENLAWLRPAYIDPVSGQLMLCIQSYIVRTRHHTILIDSCV